MSKTVLEKAVTDMLKSGKYMSLIATGEPVNNEGLQVALAGNVAQLLILIGEILHQFEKQSHMDPKDIAELISYTYEVRRLHEIGENPKPMIKKFESKMIELFGDKFVVVEDKP